MKLSPSASSTVVIARRDDNCGTLMPENKRNLDENCYEKTLRKSNLEVKPGQIDPEKMLSDPLLTIAKMVEKRHEVTEGA